MDEFFEANRKNWDERVGIHVADRTGFYDIEAFRRGEDILLSLEGSEIGDVSGKSLLHLQCHFGLDTLSLARRGAQVTGLDFSPAAIEAARGFAREAGIDAAFVEGNVYDARSLIEDRFDMVYVTWGAICWLPDLHAWAEIIAHFLKPGGMFYFADTHPIADVLDQDGDEIVLRYGWVTPHDAPLSFDEEVTYTGDETPLVNRRSHEWTHSFSEIYGALTGAGLEIEMLREHAKLPWPHFPMLVEGDDGFYRMPEGRPEIPLALSIKARKLG